MNKIFTCTFTTKKLFLLGLITFLLVMHVFGQAPVVSSFSPTTGPVGTAVTITGNGFAPAAANNVVFFGATMATVTAASTTSLTVTVPVGATYEHISVLNGNTALSGYSAKPFTTTFTPSKGSITHDDFMAPVGFDTGAAGGVFISDIDGDGKPDLVIGIKNTTVSVLRNISTVGTITASSFAPRIDLPLPPGFQPGAFAVGDLDGDGKADLITSGWTNTNFIMSVFRNTSVSGAVSFAPRVDFTALAFPFDIAIGDLDGDGKLDIAMSGGLNGGISLWRNISTPGSISAGSFEPRVDLAISDTLHSFGSYGIAIGDLDGDKKPEIVICNDLNKTISVLHNTATVGSLNSFNSFAHPVDFATGGRAGDVTIADFDGDGKPDLAVINVWQLNGPRSMSILRNNSTLGDIAANSFMSAVIFNVVTGTGRLSVGDLDGDGKPDIVLGNPLSVSSGSIVILRNKATSGSITTSSFASQVVIPTNKYTGSVAIGDLDGDGKPDIISPFDSGVINTGAGMYIFRNNPLFPPNTQATNIVFTNTAANSTTASWTNGDGLARAVFISAASTGSPLPVGSTTYTANPAYGSGSQIGSNRWYCVYNGTGNSVDITGLSSGATYRVMVVEYNGTPGAENYLTTTATGNPANITTVAGGSIAINSINRVTAQLTNAASVQYAATFATPVTGLTAGDFALTSTGGITDASISSLTGSGANYTITVNTGTGEGTIGLNLVDATGLTPGIITPLPFAGQAYKLDRTPPTIMISAPSDSTILSTRGPVTYKVTYSDLNFNSSTLNAPNVTLNQSGSATGTISVSGSDTSYTVTISNISGSGSLGISIAPGTTADSAGNAAPAAGPSKTFLITPVLSGLTTSSGTLSPVFADTTMNYTAVVNNAVNTITITPILTDPNATVTVNNVNPSIPVNLVVGLNIIPVIVTTLDGKSTTTYTVGIVRAAPSLTGKAPDISYSNGNVAITSNQPFSVTPTNKGGAVPQTHYGQVTLFAGSASETPGYVNDIGNQAQFNYVQQAVMDAAGNLYVADGFNNAIREITPAGVVTTFAGSATAVADFKDGTGLTARFSFPDGIAIDGAGNLYVSDYTNNAVRKINPLGAVTTLYQAPGPFGPGGMSIDASGNIIVAAQDASQIIKITPAGVATVLAGSTMGYANGPSLTAQFNTPGDVQPDTLGNLYVADFYNSAIRKITPAGQVTTIAGGDAPAATTGFKDGIGTATLFNYPPGLYVAPGGVVYVADLLNNNIRRIMPDGTVNLIAGSANQAPGDTDGIGSAAGFNEPDYIYIDGTGTGYISEIGGNRIRKLVLTGYALKGTLPAGLAFDPTTGIISGTPTTPFTPTTDTVTAFNAFGYSTTIFHIHYQPPSTIATLSNLVPGSGTLAPVFASSTTNYAVNVPNATSGITVTPTATDSTATIKVNGAAVTSGTASASIPLTIGSNTITIIVTAQDSVTTDTYTVIVNRAALSTVATLNDLTISNGTLTPSFATGTMNYSASVGNNINSITVTPASSDANATIQVNGVLVSSGNASGPVSLVVGPNTITTVVTAQDGTTAYTYTVIVTRAPSSDATLTNLTVSQGTLTPAFSSGTFAYTDNVSNATTSITFTPTSSDNTATITVNGTAVVSGTASASIPLAVGPNTITAVVTAQDGTTTDTYTVVVNRAPSSDATLVNLTVSQGTLAPVFSSGTTAYTDNVSNTTTNITVTPSSSDNTATITVNGTTVASGTASASIPLAVGPNTITAIVTAQDGSTTDAYTVTVNKAPSSEATLTTLVVSQGTLTPAFSSGTFAYTDNVANAATSIIVTPTVSDANATIQVNGIPVSSGTASVAIPLAIGPNTITIVVTAQDGMTTNTYTIIVTRAANSDATLTNLTVSQGTLTPAFNSGTFAYTDSVSNATTSITVTPTSSDNTATIKVNGVAVASGTASASIPLNIGPNTITTIVTAQDGTTIDTYTVVVTRAASSDATLANLTISQGTLTPTFNTGTTAYTDNVSNSTASITITPTSSDNAAVILVNGKSVANGTPSGSIPLAIGPNTITTVVTAQDGTTTDTYTVVVTRAASSDAMLVNLTVSEGTLTPTFNSGTTAYTDTISNTVSSIMVTATTSDNNAKITINGTTVANGAPSGAIPLTAGVNTITTVVSAQDGVTTGTYTITIYRGEAMASINTTNILTPNGDGKNDYWLIKDIQLYPKNNVTVYDKAGRVVYTKNGYNNEWDGTLKGSPLAEGTYYYVVDLGPNLRKFKGYISILRN